MATSSKNKKKGKPITEWPFLRFVLTAASTILSIMVLTFSAFVIAKVVNNEIEQAPALLLFVFVLLGLMSIVVYLKDRTKINLIKAIVLITVDVALGIIVLFAKDNPFLFSLTAGFYCLTIVVSRVFGIISNHNVRNIILNSLIILLAVLLAVGMLFLPAETDTDIQAIILFECIFIAIVSFIEAMSIALAQLKVKVLLRIVVSTFSLEILFGLLVMVASFSFVLMAVEDNIQNYPDALWYCFAVVTTIGFGDFVAVTPIGRILTVFLGLYGIVAVAVITSIIVNFYNETSGKKDAKELKEISEDEKLNK